MPQPTERTVQDVQRDVDALLDKLLAYINYIDEGHAIVNAGVELMSADQLAQWGGVRGWLEADQRDTYTPPKLEVPSV